MPLPVAHALVGASVAAVVVSPDDPQRWRKVALAGFLAIAPDFDFFFLWVLGWSGSWHRAFTHSIVFGLFSGAVAYVALGRLKLLNQQPRDGWAYSLAMISHGVLDATFSVQARGVEFFWPFTQNRYRFGISDLLESGLSFSSMLSQSVLEAVIFLPVFIGVLWLSGWWRRPYRSRA